MRTAVQEHPMMKDVRGYVERAQSCIDTLHLGPLDANVFSAVDCLRTAAKMLESIRDELSKAEG